MAMAASRSNMPPTVCLDEPHQLSNLHSFQSRAVNTLAALADSIVVEWIQDAYGSEFPPNRSGRRGATRLHAFGWARS